jgi:hypothetical protein
MSGAGNTYIHESTVSELSKRTYNFVVIQWTDFHRIDFKVGDPLLFEDSKYTSRYQRTRNDWAEKLVHPKDDQDLVEQDWVFGLGHVHKDLIIEKSNMYQGIYRYVDYEKFTCHFMIKLISLQNTLIKLNVPYLFCFRKNWQQDLLANEDLCKLIKWDNIIVNENLTDIMEKYQSYDNDGLHPGIEAHRIWATIVDSHIRKHNA